jgi:hypothetical protein
VDMDVDNEHASVIAENFSRHKPGHTASRVEGTS